MIIIEVNGMQINTNFCIFDGNSFQVWENKEHGKIVIDIHDKDIEKIIIVKK